MECMCKFNYKNDKINNNKTKNKNSINLLVKKLNYYAESHSVCNMS